MLEKKFKISFLVTLVLVFLFIVSCVLSDFGPGWLWKSLAALTMVSIVYTNELRRDLRMQEVEISSAFLIGRAGDWSLFEGIKDLPPEVVAKAIIESNGVAADFISKK